VRLGIEGHFFLTFFLKGFKDPLMEIASLISPQKIKNGKFSFLNGVILIYFKFF
jgi:hypothetical protein